MVALLLKAVRRRRCRRSRTFNSSLDGDDLVLKRYYNIGFAADTPQRARRAGDHGRRPEGPARDRRRADRAVGQGARRASSSRAEMQGGDVHDLARSAASAARASRRSSTRPRWRSSASTRSAMKPVWDGTRVRAAADAAAVAVLRPPRDRRRRRRALRRAPGGRARPTCGGCCCDATRRGTRPRHRRLRRRPGHRGARRRRRRGRAPRTRWSRWSPTRRRWSPVARRPGTVSRAARSRSATRSPRASLILLLEAPRRRRRRPPSGAGDGAAPAEAPARAGRPPSPPAPTPDARRPRRRSLVLGAGPGGYTAAFRAADLGLEVVLVERYEHARRRLPERRLHPVQGAAARRQGDRRGRGAAATHGISLRRAGDRHRRAARLEGRRRRQADRRASTAWPSSARSRSSAATGSFTGPHVLERRRRDGDDDRRASSTAIIAAGSSAARAARSCPTTTRASWTRPARSSSTDVPERLLVIGGGIIGLEMATVYDALGSQGHRRRAARPADPGLRPDLVKPLQKRIEGRYEAIHLEHAGRGASRRATTGCTSASTATAPSRGLRPHPRRRRPRARTARRSAPRRRASTVDERGFIAVDAPDAHERRRTSSRSATSSASRCSPTRRRTRARSRPRSSPATTSRSTRARSRRSPTPTPRSPGSGSPRPRPRREGIAYEKADVPVGGVRPRAGDRPRRRPDEAARRARDAAACSAPASSASTPAS